MADKLNLQSLIDNVLDMVKKSQDPSSQINKDKRYYKNEQANRQQIRETDSRSQIISGELDKQRLSNRGAERVQSLQNIGSTDTQNIISTGALARQRLIDASTSNIANIGLQGTMYSADKNVEAAQGRKNDPDKLINSMITSGLVTEPNQIFDLRRRIGIQNKGADPTPDDDRSYFTPTVNPKKAIKSY